MSREEAIEILKDLWRTKHSTYFEVDIRKALEIAIKTLEQESCENWYDVPSNEMNLEQARQAVRDLRKKLVNYLWAELYESNKINCKSTKCENCINHNYCDYEPQKEVIKGMMLINWQYCTDLNDINLAIKSKDENWEGLTSADDIINITYDSNHNCYVVFWKVER